MRHTINFLLTPDKAASRKVRRKVAESGSRQNIIIGTWPKLINLLNRNYLLKNPTNEWQSRVAAAMKTVPQAFWSKSLCVAPDETIEIVGDALSVLIESIAPKSKLVCLSDQGLPDRLTRRMAYFARLQDTSPAGINESALFALHSGLFSSTQNKTKLDSEAIQWLGVRDYLEEIQVAAGMIQKTLDEDASLSPSDVLYTAMLLGIHGNRTVKK